MRRPARMSATVVSLLQTNKEQLPSWLIYGQNGVETRKTGGTSFQCADTTFTEAGAS